MNYYNELDPHAAAWLRELIKAGAIPHGDVDERSIDDVLPTDLHGYTQCHFFAGIGGWPYALDLAGWPRDRPVWTGSCPCQPFSAAGKGAGFEDERHLWPAWQHLIAQCRPPTVFGEQVAAKAADAWIDLVHADLEGMGYAFGCIPFPAAGVGAPHIRDRNYWMAHACVAGLEEQRRQWNEPPRLAEAGMAGGLGNSGGERCDRIDPLLQRQAPGRQPAHQPETSGHGEGGGLADAKGGGHGKHERNAGAMGGTRGEDEGQEPETWRIAQGAGDRCQDGWPGPTNGHWRAADWLRCTDGKWRPVEPGTFPLAHGLPARVGRLRGYGNAIVPQEAAEFIRACEAAVADQWGGLPVEAAA